MSTKFATYQVNGHEVHQDIECDVNELRMRLIVDGVNGPWSNDPYEEYVFKGVRVDFPVITDWQLSEPIWYGTTPEEIKDQLRRRHNLAMQRFEELKAELIKSIGQDAFDALSAKWENKQA